MASFVHGKSLLEKRVSAAIRLRQEITAARVDRREVLKLASAAAGSLMLGGLSQRAVAKELKFISPPSAPFVQPMWLGCDAANEGCEVTAEQFAAHGGGGRNTIPAGPSGAANTNTPTRLLRADISSSR